MPLVFSSKSPQPKTCQCKSFAHQSRSHACTVIFSKPPQPKTCQCKSLAPQSRSHARTVSSTRAHLGALTFAVARFGPPELFRATSSRRGFSRANPMNLGHAMLVTRPPSLPCPSPSRAVNTLTTHTQGPSHQGLLADGHSTEHTSGNTAAQQVRYAVRWPKACDAPARPTAQPQPECTQACMSRLPRSKLGPTVPERRNYCYRHPGNAWIPNVEITATGIPET